MTDVNLTMGETTLEATLSLDTSAYASGDVLAATQAFDTGFNDFMESGGTAILQSVQVFDFDDQGGALVLLFLRSNVSIGTENAGISVTDANSKEIVAKVAIASSDFEDLGGVRLAEVGNIGKVVKTASGTHGLFIAALGKATATYTASGLFVRATFLLTRDPDLA